MTERPTLSKDILQAVPAWGEALLTLVRELTDRVAALEQQKDKLWSTIHSLIEACDVEVEQ